MRFGLGGDYKYALLTFALGCLVATGIVWYLWWREVRELEDLERKYGPRADNDT